MSDVKYSKRKKSRLEAQHMAYAIRKRITVELMASFALSQKRIEAYVESATKGIADISEREVTAKLLRELTMDRNVWFITKERDTVLDLCQGISRQLRMGNTVFPEYYSEFIERRLQLDRAMEYCNALQDELQFIAETIPCDKNNTYKPDGTRLWTDEMVHNAVDKGWITAAEFEEITGEKFETT